MRPVKEGALVGHNLTMNWGGSLHFSHLFSMPQHFSSQSGGRRCHRRHGQFINVKPFVPSSTVELSVPPFLPCEEPSSVVIRIVSNKDALTDAFITVFCERGKFRLRQPEAWWDDEKRGGTTELLPISAKMQTDDHHHHVDKEEKEEDSCCIQNSGDATTLQAATTVLIQLEKPIPPESVVKLKLQLIATTDRTKTGNLNSMASSIYHPPLPSSNLRFCIISLGLWLGLPIVVSDNLGVYYFT